MQYQDLGHFWQHWGRVATRKGTEAALSMQSRDRNDWFNHHEITIHLILDEEHESHLQWMSDKNNHEKRDYHRKARMTVQSKIEKMKENWWVDWARRLQESGDQHDIRTFYHELKTVHTWSKPQRCCSGQGCQRECAADRASCKCATLGEALPADME